MPTTATHWIPYRYPIVWHPTDSQGRALRFARPSRKAAKDLGTPTLRAIARMKSTLPCRLNTTGSASQKEGAYQLMLERDAAVRVGQ